MMPTIRHDFAISPVVEFSLFQLMALYLDKYCNTYVAAIFAFTKSIPVLN